MFMTLRNPTLFKSCSAFAPVCNPSENRWGHKVFSAYLGPKGPTWDQYDTVKVLQSLGGRFPVPVMVDQGTRDFFSRSPDEDALTSLRLVKAVNSQSGIPFLFSFREGYDHFYWFIQTFVVFHIDFHAKQLGITGV